MNVADRYRSTTWAVLSVCLILTLAALCVGLLRCRQVMTDLVDLGDLTDQEVQTLFRNISGKTLPVAMGPITYAVDDGADVGLAVRFQTNAEGIQYAKERFGENGEAMSVDAGKIVEELRLHHRISRLLAFWQQKTGQALFEGIEPSRALTYIRSSPRRCILVIDEQNYMAIAFTWW